MNIKTSLVNNISLIEVAKRFIAALNKRRNEFGTFTEKTFRNFFVFFHILAFRKVRTFELKLPCHYVSKGFFREFSEHLEFKIFFVNQPWWATFLSQNFSFGFLT